MLCVSNCLIGIRNRKLIEWKELQTMRYDANEKEKTQNTMIQLNGVKQFVKCIKSRVEKINKQNK